MRDAVYHWHKANWFILKGAWRQLNPWRRLWGSFTILWLWQASTSPSSQRPSLRESFGSSTTFSSEDCVSQCFLSVVCACWACPIQEPCRFCPAFKSSGHFPPRCCPRLFLSVKPLVLTGQRFALRHTVVCFNSNDYLLSSEIWKHMSVLGFLSLGAFQLHTAACGTVNCQRNLAVGHCLSL